MNKISNSKFVRLFLASYVDMDDIFEHDKICRIIEDKIEYPFRFVTKQNLHLTWKFFGEIQEERVLDFFKIINDITLRPINIEINFKCFEMWPDARFPRQLVIKAEDINGNAKNLYEQLNAAFASYGLKKEKRMFNPHITIGRFKLRKKPECIIKMPEELLIAEKNIKLSKLELIHSELTPKGSIYKTLKHFKMG